MAIKITITNQETVNTIIIKKISDSEHFSAWGALTGEYNEIEYSIIQPGQVKELCLYGSQYFKVSQ